MESSDPQAPRPGTARPQTFAPLIRLAVVLVAVTVFVILFQRASDVEGKLQAVLDARVEALRTGDRKAFEALHDTTPTGWWEYEAKSFEYYQSVAAQPQAAGEPPLFRNVEIVETARRMDSAWALAVPAGEPDAPRQIEFFRRAAGRWLLTAPDPDYWGEPAVHQSLYFAWRYREADDDWVKRLAPEIDAAWGQIAVDFDVVLPPQLIEIEVCYSPECAADPSRGATSLPLLTPLLAGSDPEGVKEVLVSVLTRYLGALVVGGGDQARMVGSAVLLAEIYRWETARVTGRTPDWIAPVLADAAASNALLGFDELRVSADPATYRLTSAEGYALVGYMVTHYHPRALPALLRAAGMRASVTAAVADVLPQGASMAAFEEQFLDYLRTRYGR